MTTETQTRIRRMAVELDTRERAVQLTNPANYIIRRVRTVVDGDCDFTEWGTRYTLYFAPMADGDISSIATVAQFESIAAADRHLTERAEALNGADCIDWAFCGIAAPEHFKP